MRRAAVLLVIATLIGVSAAPAAGQTGPPDTQSARTPIAGTFTGVGTYEFSSECGIAREAATLTYDATGRKVEDGAIELDLCVGFAGEGGHTFSAAGTFVLTTDSGATLTGTVSGFLDTVDSGGLSVDLTLVVTGRSGTPRPVTGTISLSGTRNEPQLLASAWSGTFSADLRPPRFP